MLAWCSASTSGVTEYLQQSSANGSGSMHGTVSRMARAAHVQHPSIQGIRPAAPCTDGPCHDSEPNQLTIRSLITLRSQKAHLYLRLECRLILNLLLAHASSPLPKPACSHQPSVSILMPSSYLLNRLYRCSQYLAMLRGRMLRTNAAVAESTSTRSCSSPSGQGDA